MAKFKISANAEVETITRSELDDALRSWMVEFGRGKRYRRFADAAPIVGGALALGDAATTGPMPGFVWSVKRLALSGLGTGDKVSLYVNDASAYTAVAVDMPASTQYDTNALVLYPGDFLVVSGSGLTGTGTVVLSGQVCEVPAAAVWML